MNSYEKGLIDGTPYKGCYVKFEGVPCTKAISSMKPLYLFDYDGVLVDSLPIFERITPESLRRLGHDFIKDHEDFLDLFRDNLYSSFAKHGVPDEDIKKCFEYVGQRVDKQISVMPITK